MSRPSPHTIQEHLSSQEQLSRRPPALIHEGWRRAYPWLVQGTTVRGETSDHFDLGLFGERGSTDAVAANWARLVEETGMEEAVHARQPHGAEVRAWEGAPSRGALGVPHVLPPCDGHVTDRPGALLAVTVADCVPVFVVDPSRRAVAMIHAGWRGAAAGVLERGLETMREAFGTMPADVRLHLGPSICAFCYEVGPEVFEALDQEVPDAPQPIDLRAILAQRAAEVGVGPGSVSVSSHCTLCTDAGLFSHRGGDAGRQVGYLGIQMRAAGS